MLSIGQFSKACQVSIKTLHHYDRIHLMHPCFIDPESGYRYYQPEQIPEMLLILRLKRYGFSLSEIKEFLSLHDPASIRSRCARQKDQLRREAEEKFQTIREMERHLENFERTGDIMGYQKEYKISLQKTEVIPVLSIRQNMSTEEFGVYFGKLFEKAAREQLPHTGETLSLYHDKEFHQECNDTEVALVLENEKKASRMIPGGLCVTTTHKGGYSGLPDAYGALTGWIEAQGYEIVDSPYERYRRSHMNELPVEEWETDVFIPVRKGKQ